ncbi:MAG: SsrA-binding protein SmpB [Bacteroidetes bacterium]|nr:SsrA-binding protein SmpB [Bacteroidota bacterium]MCH8231567.1 SsrA-binding protein SmpB [Bacteroidota bacterium]
MAKSKSKLPAVINIRNKRASFEYHLLEKYAAGIVLAGSEIKSVREGKVSLKEAYCVFLKNELYIRQMNIARYKQASYNNHEPLRERKLLLNKKELKKLKKKVDEKGLTIIPLRMFINDRGLVKLEIAVAKGKKTYDKRESIKEKDQKRDVASLRL